MRPVRAQAVQYIVWHCSATKPDQPIGADWIKALHKSKGWDGIGYHIVIKQDGKLETGEDLKNRGAHVEGYNDKSVGVCMVGGLDAAGKPDGSTFTEAQWKSAFIVQTFLAALYPGAKAVGHRDLSPDLNGDGEIQPREWLKQCPCFNAEETFKLGSPVFAKEDQPVKESTHGRVRPEEHDRLGSVSGRGGTAPLFNESGGLKNPGRKGR